MYCEVLIPNEQAAHDFQKLHYNLNIAMYQIIAHYTCALSVKMNLNVSTSSSINRAEL